MNEKFGKLIIEGRIIDLDNASEEELETVKDALTESQYLRAKHFYEENKRVRNAIKALKDNDEETFLKMINESRISSTNNLKNMMVGDHYAGSPLEACDLLMEATKNHGAIKINGGGFAGSCIPWRPSLRHQSGRGPLRVPIQRL